MPKIVNKEGWKERYLSGETVTEIADSAGCHHSCVSRSLKKMGVEMRPAHTRSINLDEGRIRKLYQEGMSYSEIAQEVGSNRETVRRHMSTWGLPDRRKSQYYKLDDDRIREMYEAGTSSYDIAHELGTSAATVLYHLRVMGVRIRNEWEQDGWSEETMVERGTADTPYSGYITELSNGDVKIGLGRERRARASGTPVFMIHGKRIDVVRWEREALELTLELQPNTPVDLRRGGSTEVRSSEAAVVASSLAVEMGLACEPV